MDDSAIRALLSRLARPHASGGLVIERAAILAEGADFPEVLAWITAHDGTPETTAAVAHQGCFAQLAFAFLVLRRQDVAQVRMSALHLAGGGFLEALGRAFVRFQFRHSSSIRQIG